MDQKSEVCYKLAGESQRSYFPHIYASKDLLINLDQSRPIDLDGERNDSRNAAPKVAEAH